MNSILKTALASLCVVGTISAFAENLLPSSDFTAESGWGIWVNKPVLDAGGSGKLEDGTVVVNSPVYDKQGPYNIQIIGKLDIPAGKTYTLKLKIKSDKDGSLPVNYGLQGAPYTAYAGTKIDVQAGEKEYTCTLNVKKDKDGNYDAPRAIRIVPGGFQDANLTFSNISLEEVKE